MLHDNREAHIVLPNKYHPVLNKEIRALILVNLLEVEAMCNFHLTGLSEISLEHLIEGI